MKMMGFSGYAEIGSLDMKELAKFFLAVSVLLLSTHSFGFLFRQLKLPVVIGEIVGGIIFGPTLIGTLIPSFYENLFLSHFISILYWVGLVLLMFISGFDVDTSLSKENKRLISAILISSTVIPFLVGWSVPFLYDCSELIGVTNNKLAFQIIFACSVTVTSIPVISRIFLDLDIMKSQFAKVVLAIAVVHDTILYIALSIATSMVKAKTQSLPGLGVIIAATFSFFVVSLAIVPKALLKINSLKANILLRSSALAYSFLICLLFTTIAILLGINIVFGAFVAGNIIRIIHGEQFASS